MKSFLAALSGCLMVAGLAGSTNAIAQSTAGALQPVSFISSDPTLTSALVYVVKSKGFDKAHAIDMSVARTGMSSSLQLDAVIAGHADFAAPGTQTALQAIRSGADLKIIASIANNQLAAVISNNALKKIDVSSTAPIADRLRAMKGMTIATNPVGATYYQMFRAYLKQYGLDPDTDVRLVPLGDSSAMISGLQYGRYDAIVSASGVVEQAMGLNAGSLWFSGARGDLPGADSTVVCVVIARSETVQKHPEEVEAVRAAFADALNFVHNDREAAGQMLKAEYFPKFDPTVWKLVWDGATAAYPATLTFPQKAFQYWTEIDPKGAPSYKDVEYKSVTYRAAQNP